MAKFKTPRGFIILVDKEDLPKIREYKVNDAFYVKLYQRVKGNRFTSTCTIW